MGKSRTTGQLRLDKYYNLAKEHGYRARSAFKLKQLNDKYKFLSKTHILIDLCAAPGGWLQVAAQEMPMKRKIIGIDLDPIKPISGVETLRCDITTENCRQELKRLLEGRKSDVVLHDGAPNVGTSWDNDSFNQNLLVLHSLRLATEFLRPGGFFITKVFRSEDYDSLMSLFNRMFRSVEGTKPLSSRSQSAEIFVVCKNFIGEENVDSSLFNPDFVFQNSKDKAAAFRGSFILKSLKFTDFLKIKDNEALNRIFDDYTNIEVDLEEEDAKKIFEEDDYIMMKSINELGEGLRKKLLKKRKLIINKVVRGQLDIPSLQFLTEEVDEISDEGVKIKTVEEKLEEIEKLMAKNSEKDAKSHKNSISLNKNNLDCFFRENIFECLEKDEEYIEQSEENIEMEEKEIEIDSCSDSIDLMEEEVLCIPKLKDNPEEFVEDTIDKYIRDPDEEIPKYLQKYDPFTNGRIAKTKERHYTKKELEVLNRRKTRAERRAERFMHNVIVEDSEEEGMVEKKIAKSSFKKTKLKPRVVITKGRSGNLAPHGKGKVVRIDRRMKKDKKKLRK